jgi:hypothetical protein
MRLSTSAVPRVQLVVRPVDSQHRAAGKQTSFIVYDATPEQVLAIIRTALEAASAGRPMALTEGGLHKHAGHELMIGHPVETTRRTCVLWCEDCDELVASEQTADGCLGDHQPREDRCRNGRSRSG